ncbi:hypothetical protein BRC83_06680 [Halobacteriales archaeon QS_1_68_17]|nr:MAG: hypothetical protein BRC83_06680 [Halobacteriales archaeon QS_1_68_17]
MLAVAGAVGGAGATRLAVEFGATLARDGRAVAVIDAAFGTQGLAGYVPGTIRPDATAVATGEAGLEAALIDHPVDTAGRLAVCPAYAPFERLARAKAPDAAERFGAAIRDATAAFDHVLVDTPPVAANQAVAAVSAADRVALVVPATRRGADALPRMRDRLDDVGVGEVRSVVNRAGGDHPVEHADAVIPVADATPTGAGPTCADPDDSFAPAVAAAVETVVDASLDLSFPETEGLSGYL